MRILAIRGENLASLGQPFTLDFETEPLVGTGLFAITGDTGSGKSTILDALCLALYGRYPRFAEQQSDTSPDPGGKVRILDGSTILRRGAGKGHAEADFLGNDGQRYRARWDARRSRDKADGPIQEAKRTLLAIHSGNLVKVATSKTEVQEAVYARTGLTFEQFCRTALLAQGEFDSFLLAPERERGDLLEKITGTEIYGRISQRVREGTKALEAEVVELERQLTGLGLLAPSERDRLEADLTAVRAQLTARSVEAEVLQGRLGRLDALLAALRRLADAEHTMRAAQQEEGAASHLRAELAELDAVETLRGTWMRAAASRSALPNAVRNLATAQGETQLADADVMRATDELSYLQTRHEEVELEFKEWGPLWDEAAALDAQISSAHEEVRGATSTTLQLKRRAETLGLELVQLQQKSLQLTSDLSTAESELASRAHQSPLADRLQEVEELLSRHEAASLAVGDAEQRAIAAQGKATDLHAVFDRRKKELEKANVLIEQQTTETAVLREELAQRDQPALEQEVELQGVLEQELGAALRAAVQHTADTTKVAEALQEIDSSNDFAAQATVRAAEATAQASRHQRQLDELSPLVGLAEDSLDQRTVALRSRMLIGVACPVCGAEEHPYLTPGREDSLTTLAAELRERRDDLRAQLQSSHDEARQATTEIATAQAKASQAEKQKTNKSQEVVNLEEAYSATAARLQALTGRFALGSPPEKLDARSEAKLRELHQACRELREESRSRLRQLRSLRAELDTKDQERHRTDLTIVKLQGKLRLSEEAAKQALYRANEAENGADRHRTDLRHVEEQLNPLLDMAAITLERLRNDGVAAVQEIRRAATAVLSARQQYATLSLRSHELAPALQSKLDAHAEALHNHGKAASAEANRKDVLRSVQAERLPLLGGEPTAEHRTRINKARVAAQEALNAGYKTDVLAKQKQASAHAAATQARQQLEAAQAENDSAAAEYIARCESIGSIPERADALLTGSTALADGLRSRLGQLNQLVQAAEAAWTARRQDVETLSAETSSSDDREALASELTSLREVEASLNQTLGQRTADLSRDTLLRQNALALELNLQAKQNQLTAWQEVDMAIGSPTGDRFRLFAQSLTLEELIVLANEHLDTFSKRYHLARSSAAELALHITDRDMGDEERPTRSLSGGERFLVSLSLALALSGLEGRDSLVDTLFIDEGFGSLDGETLDIATTALESLHSRGRKVGVITHVAAMIDTISVQIKVEKLGGGSSVVRIRSGQS